MSIQPSKSRASLKHQRRGTKRVGHTLHLPELDHLALPSYFASFSVQTNHQDSERLFHQVWEAIQSKRSFEYTVPNHDTMIIYFFFSVQQPYIMTVQSLYTQQVTQQMMEKFLVDIKLATLTQPDDQQHCNIRIQCQKIIAQGVLGH